MEMENNGASNPFPKEADVYSYSIDLKTEKWALWLDTVEKSEIDGSLSFAEMVVPTNDSIRNIFLLDHLLTNKYHVMCTGPTGTGKTVNIEQFLKKHVSAKMALIIGFSAQTSANDAQAFLDSKMEKRKKRRLRSKCWKRVSYFC